MNIIETNAYTFEHSNDALHHFQLNSDPIVLQYTGDVPFLSEKDAKTFYNDTTIIKNMALVVGIAFAKVMAHSLVGAV